MESKLSFYNQPIGINRSVIMALLASSICLFAGRSFQHLFQDIPIRILLWDRALMEGTVTQLFGVSWDEFIRSSYWDQKIQSLVRIMGLVYFSCLVFCFMILMGRRVISYSILLVGAALLFFLALLYFFDKFHRIGELIEYACQFLCPVILYLALRSIALPALLVVMRLAVALTFVGHGLYAIGFYPVPGNFIDMMIIGLGVSQKSSLLLLVIAGVLDFLVAIFIFVPRIDKYAALYATAWGGATAIARVATNFEQDFAVTSLIQWVPEVLVRVPNAVIPLAIVFALGSVRRQYPSFDDFVNIGSNTKKNLA